jgi:hypothetical protein
MVTGFGAVGVINTCKEDGPGQGAAMHGYAADGTMAHVAIPGTEGIGDKNHAPNPLKGEL